MEADIKLCEELLAMDSFPGDKPGSKTSSAAAAAGAAASADGRLTEERRGEIMTRLNKHRSSASSASAGADAPKDPVVMTAAERRERVQQLLLERQQRLAGGSTARRSPTQESAGSRRFESPASSRGASGFVTPARAAAAAGRRAVRPASAPRERPKHPPGVVAPFNLSAMKAGRHSKEAIAARARLAEEKELTFKPKTIARPRSAKSTADAVTGEERISRLSTPRTKLWQKCERIRSERASEETKECTFAPRVGRGPRMARAVSSARTSSSRPSVDAPFPDRLYADGETRYRRREDARREMAEAEMASFPFQPAINDNSRAAVEAEGYRPIHERVGELLRKKQEALAAARVQVELENPDLTFAPKVNDASRAIARGLEEEAGDRRSPVERLASGERPGSAASRGPGASARGRPSSARRKSYDAAARDEHTFAPKLNENTKRLCEMMAEEGVRGGAGSFLERQADHAAKADAAKRAIRERLEKDCTFHPNTGNADEVLLKSKHVVRLGETPRERIARLAFLEKQTREQRRLKAEEAFHKQFSFRPKLSNAARTKAPTPLHELVANPRGAEIRAAAEAAAAEAFAAEHTFEPNVGAKHTDAAPRPFQVNYSNRDGIVNRIREYRREKEVVLQEARNEREFRELEACTFQPNAGRVRSKPKPSVIGSSVAEVVPGLGRHLELRKRAKQMEEEAAARRSKAFLEGAATRDIRHRQTVPLSPKISALGSAGAKAEARRRKLIAEKEAREREACTFRPRTNERPRKELIEKLLAEDDY